MNAKKEISSVTWILWSVAVASIVILSFEMFLVAPSPPQEIINNYQAPKLNNYENIELNKECCLVTIFDSTTVKQTLTLGFSLYYSGGDIPKTYAIMTSKIKQKEFESLNRYFTVIDAINTTDYRWKEELNWMFFDDCSPVVAVSNNGVFTQPLNRICNAKPFSAVSHKGDVVYFDTSLMVLDPLQILEKDKKKYKNFDQFINQYFPKWNPLPTDLSVDDFENEYIDFWLKYNHPNYIHFTKEIFDDALNNKQKGGGSPGLYDIIKRVVQAAKDANPVIFED